MRGEGRDQLVSDRFFGERLEGRLRGEIVRREAGLAYADGTIVRDLRASVGWRKSKRAGSGRVDEGSITNSSQAAA